MQNRDELDKFVKLCGSRYSATVFVASQARILAEKYDNIISHADALRWVISGVVPDDILRYKERITQRENRPLHFTHNVLNNIPDVQVRKSVYSSLIKSHKFGHLLYVYEDVYDRYRQARIRILTRILWEELQEQEKS